MRRLEQSGWSTWWAAQRSLEALRCWASRVRSESSLCDWVWSAEMLFALLRTQHGKDHCAGKLGVVSDTVNGPRLYPVNSAHRWFLNCTWWEAVFSRLLKEATDSAGADGSWGLMLGCPRLRPHQLLISLASLAQSAYKACICICRIRRYNRYKSSAERRSDSGDWHQDRVWGRISILSPIASKVSLGGAAAEFGDL